MNVVAIENRLVEFLRSVTGRPALGPHSELLDEGIVDSLTMMDLVVFIEQDLEVRLQFDDLNAEAFRNASALAALVVLRRKQCVNFEAV